MAGVLALFGRISSVLLPISANAARSRVPTRSYLAKHVRPLLATLRNRRQHDTNVYDPRRSSAIEWNYSAELFAFAARIGESVDEELLRITFTDRSYVDDVQREVLLHQRNLAAELNTSSDGEATAAASAEVGLTPVDNEHLAASGAAIARRYTCAWLRGALPLLPEEGVQSIAERLNSEQQLAQLAAALGMTDLLLTAQYPPTPAAFSRAVLALVGAIAESTSALQSARSAAPTASADASAAQSDVVPMTPEQAPQSGLARAERLVRDLVVAPVCLAPDLHELWPLANAEAVLAAILQRCGDAAPEARLLRVSAPGHPLLAAYQVGFYRSGRDGAEPRLLGSAPGSSVKEARQLAARVALDCLMQLDRPTLNVHDSSVVPHYSPSRSLHEWRPNM